MQRYTFEKFTLGSAIALILILGFSADASAQSLTGQVSSQMSKWIHSGAIFKTAAIAACLTFAGLKLISPANKTL